MSEQGLARVGGPARGAGHGGPARGYKWPPFQEGNTAAERHGAYASPARLGPETDALAAELAPLVPVRSESDSVAIDLLALTLRRVARAEPVVAAAEDAGDLERAKALRSDQRAWVNSATRLIELLGMTPTSRARLGLDVARTEDALQAYLAERYGNGDGKPRQDSGEDRL